MKKKRKKRVGRTPEQIERHEQTQTLLAERVAYHDARIAARERGENPDAATA